MTSEFDKSKLRKPEAFDSQILGMYFSFVNTRFASPGDPGYDETKYLDGNIGFIKGKYKSSPLPSNIMEGPRQFYVAKSI